MESVIFHRMESTQGVVWNPQMRYEITRMRAFKKGVIMSNYCDVAVIGAGHAGIEAALASAASIPAWPAPTTQTSTLFDIVTPFLSPKTDTLRGIFSYL